MDRDPRHAAILHHVPVNRLVSSALLAIVVGLIPWTTWLWASLPNRFAVHDWNLVWTGFDVVLIASLAYCAWAIWARRQVMVPMALVAGTLLVCDAWFDVLTSVGTRGEWLTLATAFFGELPLAAFFFVTAARVMRRSVAAFHAAMGLPGPPPRLRDAALVSARTDPPMRSPGSGPLAPDRAAAACVGRREDEATR